MLSKLVVPLLASLTVSLAAETVWAQSPSPSDVSPTTAPAHAKFRDKFEAANTTHDGRLTLEQARSGRMPMVVKNFAAIDADHKGYITLEDIRAFRKARHSPDGSQPPAPAAPPAS
jgi:hypothetical protein